MKVQYVLNRQVGSKTYKRFEVAIPSRMVRKAGFTKGTRLRAKVSKGRITLSN